MPIVEMGLFMDVDGIPLTFIINAGNTNEQITLKPLEETLLSDFGLSNIIVCTDSGLSSGNIKFLNSRKGRNFITTTSLKGMADDRGKKFLKTTGWKLIGIPHALSII